MPLIINQKLELKPFSAKQIKKSLRASCLAAGCLAGEAEDYAEASLAPILDWLSDKDCVTTLDLAKAAAQALGLWHQDAAFYYLNQDRLI